MPDPADAQILIKILEHLTRIETRIEGDVLVEIRLMRIQVNRLVNTISKHNAEGS